LLANGTRENLFERYVAYCRKSRAGAIKRCAVSALLGAALFFPAGWVWTAHAEILELEPALPEAPRPQVAAHANLPEAGPCQTRRAGTVIGVRAASSAVAAAGIAIPEPSSNSQADEDLVPCSASGAIISSLPLIKHLPLVNWYARFLDGPQVKPLTPREKGWLAVRNVIDPFNGITILGSSAIAVGANSHSPYGPGMYGFGKYVGVSYTQDITGEFFGTFLIPSLVHQDPHYHRMPDASMKRRIAHALYQVVWTQGDNGRDMLNYANLVGYAIDDEIGNLYVPGRETNIKASAERYGTTLATAPIDNFVSEFLPDVARHIHVQIVVIQRIINQVARTGSTSATP
jgi:hypothetical protein